MSPMIKSPWEEIPFFTGGHPRVAGVSFKRVLGKAREVTVSDDTLCLLNLLQDVLWLKKKKKAVNKLTVGFTRDEGEMPT